MVCSERDLLEHTAESQFGTPGALFAQAQSTCMCDHTRKSSQTFCLFSLWSPRLPRRSQDGPSCPTAIDQEGGGRESRQRLLMVELPEFQRRKLGSCGFSIFQSQSV